MAKITLGGDEYRIFYTLDAAVELEEQFGINILKLHEMPEEDWERPIILARLLWAGILCDHPDLTVKEVGRMLDLGRLSEMVDVIGEAIKAQFDQEEDTNPSVGDIPTISTASVSPSVAS